MKSMTYPDNCIRGLNSQDQVIGNGRILASAFQFAFKKDRVDQNMEASINWEDDSCVVHFTLSMKKPPPKESEIANKVGVAVLPREAIDNLNKGPLNKGMVSYERKPIPSNPYHGNILIESSVDKQVLRMIQGSLALMSRFIDHSSAIDDSDSLKKE